MFLILNFICQFCRQKSNLSELDDLSDLMQNLSDLNLENKCDLYRPEKLLNSLDLNGVASFMKSDKCK